MKVSFVLGSALDLFRATAEIMGHRFSDLHHSDISTTGYYTRVIYSTGKVRRTREQIFYNGALQLELTWNKGNERGFTRHYEDGSTRTYQTKYENYKLKHRLWDENPAKEQTHLLTAETDWANKWDSIDDPRVNEHLAWAMDLCKKAESCPTSFYRRRFKYNPNAFHGPYEARGLRRVFSPFRDPRLSLQLQRPAPQ